MLFYKGNSGNEEKNAAQLQMSGSPIGCNSFFCPKKTLKTLALATA